MKPILYKADETNFNHRGLGALNGLLAYEVTEELNGQFEAFFEYPVNGDMYSSIEDNMMIKAKPNRVDDPHLFRIYETEVDIDTQTILIYARSNIYDLAGNMVRHVGINNRTPEQAFRLAANNALEPTDVTFYSDITTPSSTTWTRQNLLSTIVGEEGSMIQYWGGELKYGNKWIWLYRRRGNDNVTTIRYGKNLAGLKATYSTKGVVTAVLPYFTYRPEREEAQEDVTIVGNVVKSENVDSYPYVLYEAVEYDEENDGVTDADSLNQVASRYFKDHPGKDMPSINMEVNMIDLSHTKEYEKFKGLEEVELGDTITVYAAPFDMEVTAKVNRVVYNGLTEENEELEVGTSRASQYDNYRDLIDRTVDRSVQPVKEQLNITQVAANGKNTIYRGPQEPTQNLQDGDLWFKSIGDGDTELYQFNGWTWGDPIVSTEELNRVAQEVDLALTEAQEAKDEAQQSYTDAVAYTDDKVATETTEWEQTFNTKVSEINSDIGNVRQKADNALEDAGANANLLATHESALDTINNATLPTLESGLSNLENTVVPSIQSDVSTALNNVQTAQNSADSALSEAQTAIDNVDSLDQSVQTSISNINGELSSKAEQTTVDDLETTVSNHSTSISQNETDIKSKAESSTVDKLNETVSTNETNINQNAENIGLKADSSTVNQLTGDVETNSADISINADEISRRLTSTEVDNLVEGKGYSTVSHMENYVSNTAEGIYGSLEDVQAEIPTEIGGRNLIPNSNDFSIHRGYQGATVSHETGITVEEWGAEDATKITVNGGSHDTQTTLLIETKQYSETFTFSYWVKNVGDYPTNLRCNGLIGADGTMPSHTIQPGESKRVVDTGKTRDTHSWIQHQIRRSPGYEDTPAEIILWRMQLEKGTVATDWTLAPEDTTAKIESYRNDFEATAQGFRADIQAITGTQGDLSTSINTIESTANGNEQLISSIKQTPEDEITGYQSITETANRFERVLGESDEEVTDEVSRIIATSGVIQTEVSGMEFGGRNLLTGTSEEEQEADSPRWAIGSWNPDLTIGEEYTFSFDVRSENATYLTNVFLNSSNRGFVRNEPITKEWTRVHFTFEWKGGSYNGVELRPHIYPKPDYSGTYVSRIKLEKGTVATDWTPAPEDQTAYTDSAVSTVQTQLDNSWAVQTLNSNEDVMAEIAITDSTARIQGKNILLDGDVTMEQAFINDLQAHSIDAVEADITSIVTNHLGADAITANHLDVSTAMVDKLFANSALVHELTAKVAFMDSIQAMSISADQIQTGTLNASDVNIINLNVHDLVGNRLSFITGAFSGLNTDMYLNAHGITIDASEYTDMRLDRAGVTFDENGASTPVGGVSVLHEPGDQANIQGLWLFTNRGYNTSISYEVDRTDTETVYRSALMVDGTTGETNMYGRFHLENQMDIRGDIRFMQDGYHRGTIQQDGPTDDINLRYSSRFKVIRNKDNLIKLSVDWDNTYSYNNWIFNKHDLTDIGQIRGVNEVLTDKLSISTGNEDSIVKTTSGRLNFNFRHNVDFVRSNQGLVKWTMGTWSHASYAHIDLKNYDLLNVGQMKDTSDRRLKTNIEDYSESMLETFFEAINPVTFNWKDADKPQEQQIGLIAQDTPIISDYMEETDTWSIDSKKQIMLNTFGVKELLNRDNDKENRINYLESKIEGLENEITQLKGAV